MLLNVLFDLRAVMLIGSIGAFFGSLLMFVQGALFPIEAGHTMMISDHKQITVPVLEAIDTFLFGIVLVIFACGVAIGFVFALPLEYQKSVPRWMKIEDVYQLKNIIGEVVIAVLIVMFARVVVESRGNVEWNTLVLPLSILLIAIALRLVELGRNPLHSSQDVTLTKPKEWR
jgi:uncharacterized membrane protein YqhA